jgi:hypothetical protein
MTPKEKSREIFDKYWLFFVKDTDAIGIYNLTKQCALIAVDEVIEALHEHHWQNRNVTEYYKEVKHKLEKL